MMITAISHFLDETDWEGRIAGRKLSTTVEESRVEAVEEDLENGGFELKREEKWHNGIHIVAQATEETLNNY